MDKNIKPISVIIPTYNRNDVLRKTLNSVLQQSLLPAEIIIIDAGDVLFEYSYNGPVDLKIIKANTKGAASQRMEGFSIATHPYIMFMDDDIELYPECVSNLFLNLEKYHAGGVNCLVVNQQFNEPGKVTRFAYKLFGGSKLSSFAGKCFGPAINLLVSEHSEGEEAIKVDWLNTTCTLYRRDVLPTPLFDEKFSGYSFMEDVALSLKVGKKHPLFTIKTARIFHDSQPGNDKTNLSRMAEMELVNRYYIMRHVMGRKGITPAIQLIGFQLFGALTSGQIVKKDLWKGKLRAIKKIRSSR